MSSVSNWNPLAAAEGAATLRTRVHCGFGGHRVRVHCPIASSERPGTTDDRAMRVSILGAALAAVACTQSQPVRPVAASTLDQTLSVAAPAARGESPAVAAGDRPLEPGGSPAVSTTETGSFGAATFSGDTLLACVRATIDVEWPVDRHGHQGCVSPEQAALLLLDDALVAFSGGKSVLVDDSANLTKVISTCFNGELSDLERSGPKRGKLDLKQVHAILASLKWPTETAMKAVKAGNLVRVETCEFPGHLPQGTCTVNAVAPLRDAAPLEAPTEWKIVRSVFKTPTGGHDSAMKRCLQLGGLWSALPNPHVDAAEGVANSTGVADIRALESRAAQTQAAHMRAVANRSENADCELYDDCVAKIPSPGELLPGQFTKMHRACTAAKTASCKGAEVALERARNENIAVIAELQAARASN
jgi:hypothetical protein